MNHNFLGTSEKQFVEIRKVTGVKRAGSKLISISFFKKYFEGISAGDFVYFTKIAKSKFLITTYPYSKKSYEKRILPSTGTSLKMYLNEKDFIFGEYYSFYTFQNGLIMKKSTMEEIKMRMKSKRTSQSGLVRSDQKSINIQKSDLTFFKGDHGYHVEVHQGSKLFMKIIKIPKSQIQDDKKLASLSKREKESDFFEYDSVNLVPEHCLYLPIEFLKNSNMKRGDHFHLKKIDSKTMLVIPKEQKDEIMQGYFDPFEKGRKKVIMNHSEGEKTKSMQRIMNATKLDLTSMLQEMRTINKSLF